MVICMQFMAISCKNTVTWLRKKLKFCRLVSTGHENREKRD